MRVKIKEKAKTVSKSKDGIKMKKQELIEYITGTYSAEAEYPFMNYPDFAVFRHKNNKKWFAVVMDIPESKLGIDGDGIICVMNLKCDPIISGSLRSEKGIYPAYHMNKEKWISVDVGCVDTERIEWLLDISFELTAKKVKKAK